MSGWQNNWSPSACLKDSNWYLVECLKDKDLHLELVCLIACSPDRATTRTLSKTASFLLNCGRNLSSKRQWVKLTCCLDTTRSEEICGLDNECKQLLIFTNISNKVLLRWLQRKTRAPSCGPSVAIVLLSSTARTQEMTVRAFRLKLQAKDIAKRLRAKPAPQPA